MSKPPGVGVLYSCHMLGRECPEAVLPDRALYLTTFSQFLIVNKTSRALSLFPLIAHATDTARSLIDGMTAPWSASALAQQLRRLPRRSRLLA